MDLELVRVRPFPLVGFWEMKTECMQRLQHKFTSQNLINLVPAAFELNGFHRSSSPDWLCMHRELSTLVPSIVQPKNTSSTRR